MTVDINYLRTWVGKSEIATDILHGGQLASLAATLDRDELSPQPGDLVPPAGHWVYFTPRPKASEIGPDGHAKRGGFLPPVDLPRRMWAGGRMRWPGALRVGDSITRTSTIAEVNHKSGKSGDLVFVLVKHAIAGPDGVCVEEEHDIVYRGASDPDVLPPPAKAAPTDADWSRTIEPNPVLLFRYSALTFNGHRIHYDLAYVTEEEGYPGLIVHGPLIATLLMDLCRRERPERQLVRFDYRAMSPLFHIAPFTVNGRLADDGNTAQLWAADADGGLAMQAEAEFAD